MLGPYDMKVSEDDLLAANKWWRSLSVNEMKAFEQKYFPEYSWDMLGKRDIHQMWEAEGKPPPDTCWPFDSNPGGQPCS